MSLPTVSAIIPMYNAEPYIGEAIQSVLDQEGASLEAIVVDDGSTDSSPHIVKSFPAVNLIQRANGGIGAARNTGTRAATGEYIAFLDADDIWPAGRLQALLAAVSAGYDAAFGQAVQFGEGRPETDPQAALLASTMVIRRDAYARVGGFQEGLRVGEFIDWWARAEEAGLRWTQIPDVVLLRRIHTTNTGIVQAGNRVDYTRVLRAALDRRRGAS